MRGVGLVGVALVAGAAGGQTARAQTIVPPGTRHFIVLVDSSRSMVRGAKAGALGKAEETLARALFRGSRLLPNLPRYRPDDLLSVIHFGIDARPDASTAYRRLAFATLGTDYARAASRRARGIGSESFRRSLRPPFRTNLNSLAWAVPLGLATAAPRPGEPETPVQETLLILVNDAQMNGGSLALERETLGRWLSSAGRARLVAAEAAMARDVELDDGRGSALPLDRHAFGEIAVAAYRLRSLTSERAAGELRPLRPLAGVDLGWRTERRLGARFAVPEPLRGRSALAWIGREPGAATRLDSRTTVGLPLSPNAGGRPGRLHLTVAGVAPNPTIGPQRFAVEYTEEVWIPASPAGRGAMWRRGAVLALIALVVVGSGGWFLLQVWFRGHLRLTLPGYARAFRPPPPAFGRREEYRVRVPVLAGERAATLALPIGPLRRLLYRDAQLAWSGYVLVGDPTLKEEGEAPLAEFGRRLAFVRSADPPPESSISLTRTLLGRRHRVEVRVRYFNEPPRHV